MSDLAHILSQLAPLCEAPLEHDNLERISELLARKHDLAEFEVARFRVLKALGKQLEPLLRSVDPRERLRAVKIVHLTYPRPEASRVLRTMVKDPDAGTRGHARYAVRDLDLADVALRDPRFHQPTWPDFTHTTLGAWNPTGWNNGASTGMRHRSTHADVLARHDLPVLRSPSDLAALLGLDNEAALTRFTRPGSGTGAPYVEFEIPKAKQGMRRISAPRPQLKAIQRTILRQILAKLPLHEAAHGFVVGRSVVSNAAPHEGASVLVKTDLRDFFPTIHYRRVHGLFQHYGYSYDVSAALASLTTYRPVLYDGKVAWPGFLPQGAPTSPALANLVCRRLDARLSQLAAKFGATYTRYADDLTFSFAEPPTCNLGRFFWWIDQICQHEGFVEHPAKRRILRPHTQQRVTGVVVNSGLHIPRAARRQFRAILSNCRRHGLASQARGRSDFADYLRGFAAYVHMVQPALGQTYMTEVETILAAESGAGS